MSKAIKVAEAFGINAPEEFVIPAGPGGENVPETDPNFVFRERLLGDFLGHHLMTREPLWFEGPTGSGKTSFVLQVAARLEIPVFYTTGKNEDAFSRWVGSMGLLDGETVFNYGPLPLAMLTGGWFVVDEADLTPPDQLAEANNVLAGGNLTLDDNGGEVIKPAPGFRFIACGNTTGADAMANAAYLGTKLQNAATLSRFSFLKVPYPSKEEEVAVLQRVTNQLGEADLEAMVDLANAARTAAENPAVNFTAAFSTRILVRWARFTEAFKNAAHARGVHPMFLGLAHAFTNGLPEGEVEVLYDLAKTVGADFEEYLDQARRKGVSPVDGPVYGGGAGDE